MSSHHVFARRILLIVSCFLCARLFLIFMSAGSYPSQTSYHGQYPQHGIVSYPQASTSRPYTQTRPGGVTVYPGYTHQNYQNPNTNYYPTRPHGHQNVESSYPQPVPLQQGGHVRPIDIAEHQVLSHRPYVNSSHGGAHSQHQVSSSAGASSLSRSRELH
jgi:hypothetical protein